MLRLLLIAVTLAAPLAVALVAPAVPAHAAGPKAPPSAEELYETGLRQMRRGYYAKALESFNRVRNYHRDDPVSVKAQLAIADLHFKKGDFAQARFAYEEFAQLHPRHPDLDYVTWRIGLSIYKRAAKFAGRDQTDTRAAVNAWTGFDSRFPDSDWADDVDRLLQKGRERLAAKELFIAKFYQRRDAWGAVRGRTEYLVRRYPDVPQVAEALERLGVALHAWGSVDEANAVRDRLATDFPESHWLERLDRALARPAGEPPDEKVFLRPYRVRGTTDAGPGQPPQGGGA